MDYIIKNEKCAVEILFKMIGAKWKPMILYCCFQYKEVNYSILKDNIYDISDTMLFSQINELIHDELLTKSLDNKYYLTEKTKELTNVLTQLDQLSKMCGYNQEIDHSSIEYSKRLIGNRWKSRIIWIIHKYENVRFNQLKRSIEGISHKILTEQLKIMEKDDLIKRTVINDIMPHVEYSLTEKGKKAYLIIDETTSFCKKYQLLKSEINYFDVK